MVKHNISQFRVAGHLVISEQLAGCQSYSHSEFFSFESEVEAGVLHPIGQQTCALQVCQTTESESTHQWPELYAFGMFAGLMSIEFTPGSISFLSRV